MASTAHHRYGFSQGLLELIASPGYGYGDESDALNILFAPTTSGSHWTNGQPDWVYQYEDMFACALVDRTMARHPQLALNYRLLDPDGKGLWLHSGAIKQVDEYLRCQQVGLTCFGESGTHFTRPAAFDPMQCRQ